MQRVGHGPQMLTGMIKVQSLTGLGKAVIHQVPNPHRTIGNHQNLCRLAHSLPQTLGKELFPQCLHAASGHHGSRARDDRTTGIGLRSLFQSKTSAAINPMPAGWLDALGPLLLTLPPITAFSNVPSINLNDQGEGLLLQRHTVGCLGPPSFADPTLCVCARHAGLADVLPGPASRAAA